MLQRFSTPLDNHSSDLNKVGSEIGDVTKKSLPVEGLEERASTRGDGAFFRFPDVVIRNKNLSAEGLFILVFRATFKGNFAIREEVFAGESASRPVAREGFGINVCRGALAECKKLGYLKRWQVGQPGSYGEVKERVHLPDLGHGGLQGVHVKRRWFNATLSVKEMAAFLFTQSGTGLGPDVYVREVADRFDWSLPTARKILNALENFGLVKQVTRRNKRGRFLDAIYRPLRGPAWQIWRQTPALANDSSTAYDGEPIEIQDKKACTAP